MQRIQAQILSQLTRGLFLLNGKTSHNTATMLSVIHYWIHISMHKRSHVLIMSLPWVVAIMKTLDYGAIIIYLYLANVFLWKPLIVTLIYLFNSPTIQVGYLCSFPTELDYYSLMPWAIFCLQVEGCMLAYMKLYRLMFCKQYRCSCK